MARFAKNTVKVAKYAAVSTALFVGRYYLGRGRADEVWNTSYFLPLNRLGSVDRLSILPLIDFYASKSDLATEAGVSYLIKADDTTILMDLGLNEKKEHPSPLLRNMEALGVSFNDIDKLVITHAHCDHIGGLSHQLKRTFAPSGKPVDLHDTPVYTPVALSNPTTMMVPVGDPQYIAPGVASTGRIPRQLFFLGWTQEHSLLVNVRNKGIVVIAGCGHQTARRIIGRTEMLSSEPLYGFIGGLHFPVTASRDRMFGLPAQQVFGTGLPPWRRISPEMVEDAIELFKERDIKLIGLSPHDSCDWSLGRFRDAFGPAYEEVEVGREIVVDSRSQPH